MPTFLMITRHAPENCPMFNEKTRKTYVDWFSNMDKISKKYKMKMLWGGGVISEHLSVFIIEAPSLEAFQKASMEPEALALGKYETAEVKLATGMEEAMKMLKAK
jgi:hypothetical protein